VDVSKDFSGAGTASPQEAVAKAVQTAKSDSAERVTRLGAKERQRDEAEHLQKREGRAERSDQLGKTNATAASRMDARERLKPTQSASAAKTNADPGVMKSSGASMQTQNQMRTQQAADQRSKMMDSMSNNMMNRQTNMQNNMMRNGK
jgi:hypothetical protein